MYFLPENVWICRSVLTLGRKLTCVSRFRSLLALITVSVSLGGYPVHAQQPFLQHDPLYQDESALRTFFDRYAFSTEIYYLPSGSRSILDKGPDQNRDQDAGVNDLIDAKSVGSGVSFLASGKSESIGVRMRLDYRIIPELDASFIFGMQGVYSGFITLDWVALKYFRHSEDLNYAIRLAANPRNEFGGFPQVDFSFLTHNRISPDVTSDFAIGWRQVRHGLAQPGEEIERNPLLLSRAGGQELHIMRKYHYSFDPAGSHVFGGLTAKFGSYEFVEAYRWHEILEPSTKFESDAQRGGVVWLQTGVKINRPSFQLTPYINVPVRNLGELTGDLHLGIRFTVR